MKAAIHNPYLDTLGGGERYMSGVIKVLEENGYDVSLEWDDKNIVANLEKRFGINFDDLQVKSSINKGEGYDLCFWFSDGSIPLLHSRNNILHFQFPFTNVSGKTLMNKMKLFRINTVVVNSMFTKQVIDKEFGIKSLVIYPPVDIEAFKPSMKKRNIILAVGRFSQLTQSKNQHILMETFRTMINNGLKGWKLVLAGGVEVGADKYVERLTKMSTGLPVEINKSPSFDSLKKLYESSKIFWSASGYGIDETKVPTRVEHFGITVVEAMAAGCYPLVYDAGGHKEIVSGKNLWITKKQLREKTMKLIQEKVIESNNEKIERFGYKMFKKRFENIL